MSAANKKLGYERTDSKDWNGFGLFLLDDFEFAVLHLAVRVLIVRQGTLVWEVQMFWTASGRICPEAVQGHL